MSLPLPNFLIVGASRSGTTSLHSYLHSHPDVCLGEPKEVRFFERDTEYSNGLEHYRRAFASWSGQSAIGEASPPYFFHGISFDAAGKYRFDSDIDAARRIARDLPDVRIVITLRDPVSRAYSQFWKSRRQEREPLESFRAVLDAELSGERSRETDASCWVYKNRYSIHLPHWLELFGRERVHVMIFEEWTADPAPAFAELCRFLRIDPDHQPDDFGVHNAAWMPRSRLVSRVTPRLHGTGIGRALGSANRKEGYPELDAETAAYARDLFRPDLDAVASIVGHQLPWGRVAPTS